MRVLLTALAVAASISGTAIAADTSTMPTDTKASSSSTNNAVNGTGNQNSTTNASGTINVVTPSALEKGANSFTEGQAKSRIESAGFTSVTGLQKDADGIWRGKAMHDGKNVDVGFDYKGSIGVQR